ncbi:hypothetical protein JHK84_050241 [Glycine max]|nr:hypothetical protein JHK86_050185 [Glycine max]KAG5094653.1 hypothetical protein JHK84_050241 [Glycine max]
MKKGNNKGRKYELLCASRELTNEEHGQCCEMAKIMLKVVVAPEAILNTVNAKDQIYGEVSRSFAVRWKDVLDLLWNFIDKDGNFHTVVYNQDLDKPTIVAGWTTLRDFYHLTGDHQRLLRVGCYRRLYKVIKSKLVDLE